MKLFIPFTYLVKLDTLVYSQAINLAKDGGKSYLKKTMQVDQKMRLKRMLGPGEHGKGWSLVYRPHPLSPLLNTSILLLMLSSTHQRR